MSPSLFILSITIYLVSMVAGLIGSFFVKYIPVKLINFLVICHSIFFISWLFLRNETETIAAPGNSNYLFLVFFCSGIICAGLLLRSKYPVYLKIYFSAYLLSLVVFVVSPSRVLGFIVSGNFMSVDPSRYHISENYYFVEQQKSRKSESGVGTPYKLIREMGMFHKTLSRDIILPAEIDSIKLTENQNEHFFKVRIYHFAAGKGDSTELEITSGNHRDKSNDIQQIREQ